MLIATIDRDFGELSDVRNDNNYWRFKVNGWERSCGWQGPMRLAANGHRKA
jgi:hypothetical protein